MTTWKMIGALDDAVRALDGRVSVEAHAALEAALAGAAIEVLHRTGGHVAARNADSMRVAGMQRRRRVAAEQWARRAVDALGKELR